MLTMEKDNTIFVKFCKLYLFHLHGLATQVSCVDYGRRFLHFTNKTNMGIDLSNLFYNNSFLTETLFVCTIFLIARGTVSNIETVFPLHSSYRLNSL